MNLKLLALAGIMTAAMGMTACDSKTENAAESLSDAQEEVQDAAVELDDAAAEGEVVTEEAVEAVEAAEADIAVAQVETATDEIDAEVPVDGGATTSMDIASETDTAVEAADTVVAE